MTSTDTAIVVVDVQEKLLPKIRAAAMLVNNIAFLLDAAKLLNVPVFATEQYPKGLGRTVPELAKRLPVNLPEKVAFSCCEAPSIVEGLRQAARPSVIVTGIETHVCVLQTTLDLLALDFRVFVPVDGVSNRYEIDHNIAVQRMEQSGAVLTTVETAVFELTRSAGSPAFKGISQLVQERMKLLA
jgi:nicotinamidase-related amidase